MQIGETMRTILFAGNDRMTREPCRRALEDEGYRVVLAGDGVHAVNVWKSERPDAIVLDNLMPQKQALQAAAEIGTLDPGVPIILYVGYDDTYTRDARARFVTACVDKSTDLTELQLAIRRALSSQDHGRQLRVGLPPIARKCTPR